MLKAAILFFGLLLVAGFYFQDDIAYFAQRLADGKGSVFGSKSVGKGMESLGDALSSKFELFGEGLK